MTSEIERSPELARNNRLTPGERTVYVLPLDAVAPDPQRQDSLLDLLKVILEGRWWIALLTSISLALGAGYILLAPKRYRAEVLLMPATSLGNAGIAEQLGGLGGLASLAGIDLGGGGTVEPVATMRSSGVVRSFIDQKGLLPTLFATKWDSTSGRWRDPEPRNHPDLRDGVRKFERNIRAVTEDKKTGLVRLSIEWSDPEVAAEWANEMVEHVNVDMRKRAIDEASANLRFLEGQLAELRVVELKEPIGRLIEMEMQKLMLARGQSEFGFRIIDKATPPKWPSRPKRAQSLVLAGMLGLLLSTMFVLGRHMLRTRSHDDDTGAKIGARSPVR